MGKIIANITEIFSSIQGEGPYTGKEMTFVRFAGCSLACRWCDTEAARNVGPAYRVETPPKSKQFVNYTNPVTIEKLNEQLAYFSDQTISVTGGEPLEQVEFLKSWLVTLPEEKKVLLETNGVFPKELDLIAKHVNIISMDIKLPSSTGAKPCWKEHALFISNALKSGKEFYIKIVVTQDTTNKDIQEAIKLVSSANKYIPVILQPVSETGKYCTPITNEHVESIKRLCGSWLPNVSIMRQTHKEKGLL